ncbi:hypothetical protein PVAG01_07864 [Phlyctema vagabunda]|uniref:AttH domain-containing protein n=1 Tax=Phlyctema vagabunda TaxID=108571 RepID=A0ABR4PDM2_9HELO
MQLPLVTLGFVPLALGFLRTAPDISPLDIAYTSLGPVPNVTDAQGFDAPARNTNSYWIAHWLTAENGHDYFAIACHAQLVNNISTLISLLDITMGDYFGSQIVSPGRLSSTAYGGNFNGLDMYAATDDQFSTLVTTSNISGASFNLTSTPRGPNLYHGGSTSFFWGTGITNELAAPEMYVTGTITTLDGSKVNVTSNQSISWLDRQWGPGIASGGWLWFDIILEDGIKIAAWFVNPVSGSDRSQSFATILYPDSRHEVVWLDPNLVSSEPITSDITGIVYNTSYQIKMPIKNAEFNITMPVKVGEMPLLTAPSSTDSILEGFSLIEGIFDGLPAKGFGLIEIKTGLNV